MENKNTNESVTMQNNQKTRFHKDLVDAISDGYSRGSRIFKIDNTYSSVKVYNLTNTEGKILESTSNNIYLEINQEFILSIFDDGNIIFIIKNQGIEFYNFEDYEKKNYINKNFLLKSLLLKLNFYKININKNFLIKFFEYNVINQLNIIILLLTYINDKQFFDKIKYFLEDKSSEPFDITQVLGQSFFSIQELEELCNKIR